MAINSATGVLSSSLCGFLLLLLAEQCTCYELTIVHNNDVHAHFEQVNKYSGECSEEQAQKEECYGGEARRVTFINEARQRYQNTLVLDAGDRFTGTLWFTHYHGYAASVFVNRENYDAMCLGNHEFDLGVEGLVPYLENLTIPVLDANIDVSREPRLRGLFNQTLVKTVGGVKIGIIGITSKDTSFISKPGPTVKFKDEVETVRTQAKLLKDSGVPIIIVLSHSGYGVDKKIAAQVDGVDVIVGGHSHTFLYSGEPLPSVEEPEGPYPTIIKQASGRTVLVVQAYAWGKYMGFLNVTFNDNYEVASWSGSPVLLDKTIPRDNDTLELIQELKKPLEKIRQQVVGSSLVRMEGDPIQCRLRECNSGNLLTDSMVDYARDKKPLADGQWAPAAIALLSGGGIRASTEPGNVTMGQVLTVQPFGNNVEVIRLHGVHLRKAFEHSVYKYDRHDRPGAFFQVSGIHVSYDLSKSPGSRVISLDARCLNCTVPEYRPVNDSAIYNILMVDFTIDGGDDYFVIKNNLADRIRYGWLDSDVFTTYLRKNSPIYADTEGRIKFVEGTTSSGPILYSMNLMYYFISLALFTVVIKL